ncbi:hypothetical protein C1646_773815 [Rhizophagus diaphanus]|nr:hypothetical protein C1646_773815 [Rhizophagus diaphanus] [Rhizophagus sp. MUCL 43196]
MARVFDNTDVSRRAKKSGLKTNQAKLGLLNSALHATYGLKFKAINKNCRHYHLENGKETRYRYSKLPPDELILDNFTSSNKYFEWCGENGEKLLTSKVAGKKFSDIGIESKQVRTGGDMKEFSDISQADVSYNEIANIPIFNMLETIPPKIILLQPEKKLPPRDKKTAKISKVIEPPKPIIDKLRTNKLPNSKPINEISSAILPAKA